MNPIELVLPRLSGVRENSTGWTAKCPAHDDQKPSLSIKIGDNGNVVPYCHAGCEYKEIVDALGLQPSDLYPKGSETAFRSDSHPNELHSRPRKGPRKAKKRCQEDLIEPILANGRVLPFDATASAGSN